MRELEEALDARDRVGAKMPLLGSPSLTGDWNRLFYALARLTTAIHDLEKRYKRCLERERGE